MHDRDGRLAAILNEPTEGAVMGALVSWLADRLW